MASRCTLEILTGWRYATGPPLTLHVRFVRQARRFLEGSPNANGKRQFVGFRVWRGLSCDVRFTLFREID